MNALIFNGKVVQIEAATFPVHSALTWVAIPSGTDVVPGWSYSGGTFTAPPAPPAPTLAQQAATLIAGGLTITSTSKPALNGAYACDDARQARINRIQGFIAANSKFPNSLTALPWPDISGVVHEFPSTAEFTAFASAVADYVMALDAVIMGISTTLPPAKATIP